MVAEAALSLISNMEGLTEGLNLGIVVLFLQEQVDTSSTELDCAGQNEGPKPEILAIIITLSMIIIIIILTFLLICGVYLR